MPDFFCFCFCVFYVLCFCFCVFFVFFPFVYHRNAPPQPPTPPPFGVADARVVGVAVVLFVFIARTLLAFHTGGCCTFVVGRSTFVESVLESVGLVSEAKSRGGSWEPPIGFSSRSLCMFRPPASTAALLLMRLCRVTRRVWGVAERGVRFCCIFESRAFVDEPFVMCVMLVYSRKSPPASFSIAIYKL